MKTSDFYYDLPEELIAQTPIEPRDHSRLMVLDKKTGSIGPVSYTHLGGWQHAGSFKGCGKLLKRKPDW